MKFILSILAVLAIVFLVGCSAKDTRDNNDTLNFVPNMEKAKFFSMEEGEPNICDKVEKKW